MLLMLVEKLTIKTNNMRFIKEDLKDLEYNVNELIENIYSSGRYENFKTEIEHIENFFSYYEHHLKV